MPNYVAYLPDVKEMRVSDPTIERHNSLRYQPRSRFGIGSWCDETHQNKRPNYGAKTKRNRHQTLNKK